MSFKLLLLFLFIISGCGVKSDPSPPEGAYLPSYSGQFVQSAEEAKLKKKK